MTNRVRALLCVWLFLVAIAPAFSESDKHLAIPDLLWPQTHSWRLVSDAPLLSKEKLKSVQTALSAAYMPQFAQTSPLEGKDCSLLARAFDWPEWGGRNEFHSLDINQDGLEDILYVGSAHCAEGEATIAWISKDHSSFEIQQKWMLNLKVQRLSPDGSKFTSVSIGCCGDPIDGYNFGTWKNPRVLGNSFVETDTQLPATFFEHPVHFNNKHETVLRRSPANNNRFDDRLSHFMAHSVFGNQLRKYLSGASGIILAQEKDARGTLWHFVRIDDDSDYLLTHAPFKANVGWVRGITLTKEHKQ